MKISITYFYNIRFFKPNQIPVSTALFDPKWYHNFKNKKTIFLDKNNVVNGFNLSILNPDPHSSYCTNCDHTKSDNCQFLKEYRKKIFSLNKSTIDFVLKSIAVKVQSINHFEGEPEIVLIVHEKPDNPCSERQVLKDYFKCEEWKDERT